MLVPVMIQPPPSQPPAVQGCVAFPQQQSKDRGNISAHETAHTPTANASIKERVPRQHEQVGSGRTGGSVAYTILDDSKVTGSLSSQSACPVETKALSRIESAKLSKS